MSDTLPPVDFYKLRALTEAAGGFRDQDVYLVFRDGAYSVVEKLDPNEKPLLRCRTEADVENRPKAAEVRVKLHGRDAFERENYATEYDALFWTEASVFKFVMAYYPWVKSPQQLSDFLKKYNKENVFAVAHVPKSLGVAIKTSQDDEFKVLARVLKEKAGPTPPPTWMWLTDYLAAVRDE